MSPKNSDQKNSDQSLCSDEDLMDRYIQGDPHSFEILYYRHAKKVSGILLNKIENKEVVSDLHQKIFLKFHQKRHLYEKKYLVTQFLFVITKTTMIDYFRENKRDILGTLKRSEDVLLETIPSPEIEGDEKGEPSVSLEMLEGLSNEQKEALKLRVIDELSFEEIAVKLNKSNDSIRKSVSRAVQKIRNKVRGVSDL